MGFNFNGYDINGSPLTYNTNYINIMRSWWHNVHILNGTLTISPNLLYGNIITAFTLVDGHQNQLEELNLVITDLVANDFENLPFFVIGNSYNFKNFSYSINNIESGDFFAKKRSIPKFLTTGMCPNLSNDGVINILNCMDEIYSKTNINSWFGHVFANSSLSNITLKNFIYGEHEQGTTVDLEEAFFNAKVKNLTFENFKVNNISNLDIRLNNTFYNCQNLQMGSLNTNFFSKLDSAHTNLILSNTFWHCYNLTEIPDFYNSIVINAINTFSDTGITTFPKYTFSKCYGEGICQRSNILEISDLQYTNSHFTSLNQGFYECLNLTKINNISLKNISGLSSMFDNCTNLSQIDNVKIENIKNSGYIFDHCQNLKTINNFTMTNVSYAAGSFRWCSNLVGFINSTISQVENMDYFFCCSDLITLPNLDFSKTTSAENIFKYCDNLSANSLNYFGMVLPNRSNLTNISTYNLSYFGLTNNQINVIANNTTARLSVQRKGWEIANLEPKRIRVTEFAQMNNNKLENIKIGMDAERIIFPGGILNFIPNETNIPTVINKIYNYLDDQINTKYRAFDISFDTYSGSYNESIDDYDYIFNQHINTRIYSDFSEDGTNLRNYLQTYDDSIFVGNLNIIEVYAPNFINAHGLLSATEAIQ